MPLIKTDPGAEVKFVYGSVVKTAFTSSSIPISQEKNKMVFWGFASGDLNQNSWNEPIQVLDFLNSQGALDRVIISSSGSSQYFADNLVSYFGYDHVNSSFKNPPPVLKAEKTLNSGYRVWNFSKPVNNPVLAIYSLGAPWKPVVIETSTPCALLNEGNHASPLKVLDKNYSISDGYFTWSGAKTDAETKHGNLACIGNSGIYDRVTGILMGKSIYLGGTNFNQDRAWVWHDGTPWAFSNWLPGEPNDSNGGEYYVVSTPSLGWNDATPGTTSRYLFESNLFSSVTGYYVSGSEANGIVIFPGTHSSITLSSKDQEYYTNLVWGCAPDFTINDIRKYDKNLNGYSQVATLFICFFYAPVDGVYDFDLVADPSFECPFCPDDSIYISTDNEPFIFYNTAFKHTKAKYSKYLTKGFHKIIVAGSHRTPIASCVAFRQRQVGKFYRSKNIDSFVGSSVSSISIPAENELAAGVQGFIFDARDQSFENGGFFNTINENYIIPAPVGIFAPTMEINYAMVDSSSSFPSYSSF